MDYVARQFINLTKKLRKELRKALATLSDALNKQTEAIRKSYEHSHNDERPPQEIVAIVNLPPRIEVHQNAADTTTERRYRDRTLLVSILTFLAIVFYAALVYLQYREMINATGAAQQAVVEARLNRLQSDKAFKATVEQFRLDERPYVWVEPHGGTPDPNKPSGDIVITVDKTGAIDLTVAVHVRNFGKSPAVDVKLTDSEYKIGPAKQAMQEARLYKPRCGEKHSGTILIQNSTSGLTPGSEVRKLTKPEYDSISNGAWDVYIVGGIQYRDIFDPVVEPYETTYCFHLQMKGLPFADCAFGTGYFGNSIK
jgi:hypothetical protein